LGLDEPESDVRFLPIVWAKFNLGSSSRSDRVG
jgi:hypothetical protein